MLSGKSLEYWAALVAMTIWLATRDAERESIMRRLIKTVVSGLLAVGLSPGLTDFAGFPEAFSVVVIMGLGLLCLDVATALLSDRKLLMEIIASRLGKK